MADKTPIRTVFTGSTATGLAEFQSGDTVGLTHGGIGVSLSIGSAGQVLKVNSGASALEFGNVEAVFNIDGMTDGSSITIVDADDFAISDAGTEKRVNASQIKTYVSAAPTITGTAVMADLDISGDVDVDGTLETDALSLNGTTVTSTAAEINLIDGGASTGTTAVADADGIITNDGGTMRLTTAATFKTYFQSGISSAADDISAGDAAVNITTSSGNITVDAAANDSDVIFKGTDDSSDITMLTLDGSDAGSATFNDKVIVGDGKLVLNSTAVTSTAAELNLLDGVSGLVQADLTKLAAVDSTATELNIVDGGTSATSTTVADADRVVMNDNGTMVQVAVTDLAAYFDDEITAMGNLVETGALDAGSITSGFGTIDTGASAITTTGLISGGSLDIDNVLINGTTIGHTDDTDLMTVADGILTVAGEVSMTTLDIGGTNVTSTATELNFVDGVTSNVQTQMNTKSSKGFAFATSLIFG